MLFAELKWVLPIYEIKHQHLETVERRINKSIRGSLGFPSGSRSVALYYEKSSSYHSNLW